MISNFKPITYRQLNNSENALNSFSSFPVVVRNRYNQLDSVLMSIPQLKNKFSFSSIVSPNCSSIKAIKVDETNIESSDIVQLQLYTDIREMLKLMLADTLVYCNCLPYVAYSFLRNSKFFIKLVTLHDDTTFEVEESLHAICDKAFLLKGNTKLDILSAINLMEHPEVRLSLVKLGSIIERSNRNLLGSSFIMGIDDFLELIANDDNRNYIEMFTKEIQITVSADYSSCFGTFSTERCAAGVFSFNQILEDDGFPMARLSSFVDYKESVKRLKQYGPFDSYIELMNGVSAVSSFFDTTTLCKGLVADVVLGGLIQSCLEQRDCVQANLYNFLLSRS